MAYRDKKHSVPRVLAAIVASRFGDLPLIWCSDSDWANINE